MSQERINVTRSSMPSYAEYCGEIKEKKDRISLEGLKEYYGKHLQGFVGDALIFSMDLKKEKKIPFAQALLDRITIPHGATLEVYEGVDEKGRTVFTIAPINVPDMITGGEVDFKKEIPEPVVICEECNSN